MAPIYEFSTYECAATSTETEEINPGSDIAATVSGGKTTLGLDESPPVVEGERALIGARAARRGLIRAGFGAAPSVAAAPPGSLFGATPEQECALLAETADYIGEGDPLMIGAAWLLEQEGYERSQLCLLGEASRS